MTAFQTLRMIWIDAWLTRETLPLQRIHLQRAFDISGAQAAKDFCHFKDTYPNRMEYDVRKKGHFRGEPPNHFAAWQHDAAIAASDAIMTELLQAMPR